MADVLLKSQVGLLSLLEVHDRNPRKQAFLGYKADRSGNFLNPVTVHQLRDQTAYPSSSAPVVPNQNVRIISQKPSFSKYTLKVSVTLNLSDMARLKSMSKVPRKP